MTTTRLSHQRTALARRAERGFTVLETMIAMAVVAMLAAVAAPGMLDFIRSNRMSTSARQFDADLVLARREAIKRNLRVLVCPVGATVDRCGSGATAWANGWLVCYDADQDNECDATANGDPNPIRKHGAIEANVTAHRPHGGRTVQPQWHARRSRSGQPHFHDPRELDRLEILRRDRHRDRQRFDGRRELT
jgi:prepilin-type N-terminal cleavage/methylation domain-containing protein